MNKTLKNLLITIGVIVLLVVGLFIYSDYFVTDQSSALSIQGNDQNFPGSQIQAELNQLSALNLDAGTVLFADPAYQSLQDSSIVLNPEPIGRSNPFAPVIASVPQPIQKASPSSK